jgi:hypothetical protein
MATLAELEAQRDGLLKSIASGQRRVKIGNSEIEYQSTAELQAALALVNSQIKAAQGRPRIGIVYASSSKGI